MNARHLHTHPVLFSLTLVPLALGAGLWTDCSPRTTAAGETRAQAGGQAASAPAKPSQGTPTASISTLSGPHYPVYSLHDNRLMAHLIRDGGLFIPLGYPGAAKYLNFGRPWTTLAHDRRVAGEKAAAAVRPVGWVVFPLTQAQAGSRVLTLRLFSARAQGLRLKLNARSLQAARLDAGWQTVETPITAGALTVGENRLELGWSASAGSLEGGERGHGAVAWIGLGNARMDPGPTLTPASGSGLYLAAGGGLAIYILPYKESKLRLAFTAPASGEACSLTVGLHADGIAPVLHPFAASALPAGRPVDLGIDLAPVADRVARLELLAGGETCRGLTLSVAEIVRPGSAPALVRQPAPKNVLFWMIDNVRADRYTLYNPKTRVKTPVITALGNTGTVFEHAYIQGTESRVSHASIWTSLFPKQHRFVDAKAKLPLSFVTLPEAVQKAGLYTTAWIANGFVSKFWGFGEGWNYFRNTLHDGGGLDAQRLADHAIKFVETRGDRPFYAYVGTIDPHVSWRGRQPWLNEYHPEPYSGTFVKDVLGPIAEKIATGARPTTPADRKRILAIYDSTVSYNDQHLGRLLEALKKKGILEQTMIVITADHGEELWDYGGIGHGQSCRDTLVAVPLVIHYPPLFGKGVRVREGVNVLSIMPTVLDALGASIPDEVQGESLMPLAQGVGRGYPRPSLATQYEFAHTMRVERWKLRVGGKGEPRLHDMESPKPEIEDLVAKRPLETRFLSDGLSMFLIYQNRWRSLRWGVVTNHRAAMPDDLEAGKAPEPIRPPS